MSSSSSSSSNAVRDSLTAEAKQRARAFAPHLTHAASPLPVKEYSGGVTNRLVRVADVLVRLYGAKTELLVDRDRENALFQRLADQDLAPPFYGSFGTGIVYGHVDGRPLEPSDVRRDESIQRAVCKEMLRWHSLDVGDLGGRIDPHAACWTLNARRWCAEADRPLLAHVDEVEQQLAGVPLRLCHNDLLAPNIILRTSGDAVRFIDYEYGGPNPVGFDVGNHWNEWMGFDVLHADYPTEEEQRSWIRLYLQHGGGRGDGGGGSGGGGDVDEEAVARLRRESLLGSLASHLMWSFWSRFQAKHSTIDFDFAGYAELRLGAYRHFRREWSWIFQ